ncbi:hypothetical protein LguiA_027124 [Lonicera macranthoides]
MTDTDYRRIDDQLHSLNLGQHFYGGHDYDYDYDSRRYSIFRGRISSYDFGIGYEGSAQNYASSGGSNNSIASRGSYYGSDHVTYHDRSSSSSNYREFGPVKSLPHSGRPPNAYPPPPLASHSPTLPSAPLRASEMTDFRGIEAFDFQAMIDHGPPENSRTLHDRSWVPMIDHGSPIKLALELGLGQYGFYASSTCGFGLSKHRVAPRDSKEGRLLPPVGEKALNRARENKVGDSAGGCVCPQRRAHSRYLAFQLDYVSLGIAWCSFSRVSWKVVWVFTSLTIRSVDPRESDRRVGYLRMTYLENQIPEPPPHLEETWTRALDPSGLAGFSVLGLAVHQEAFTYMDGQKEYVKIDHNDLYPYLLVNIGSSVSMIKVVFEAHSQDAH